MLCAHLAQPPVGHHTHPTASKVPDLASFSAVARDLLAGIATTNVASLSIENLVLDNVRKGNRAPVTLPLKLMRADVSPVSAMLRELP